VHNLEVTTIPSDYLINSIKENVDKTVQESIFLIKTLRIRNTLESKITLKKIKFKLKAKGISRQEITYTKEVVSERAEQLKEVLGFLGVTQKDPVRELARIANALLFMGQESFWNYEKFTTNYELEAGQEIGYRLEVFRIVSPDPIDELKITIVYEHENKTKKENVTIQVKVYETTNDYIFPVKGAWLIFGNWDDTFNHRTMHSQEFAFDLVQYNDDLKFPQTESTPNEKFKCYGKEVLAIADGEVVDCFDGAPENPTAPEMIPNEKRREIAEKYGFTVVASGNYVIIKHKKKEYSFYGHLKTDTVTVNKGQKVKQGQVIGKVGNSGNSTGPHLHFHLMAEPSILTGRGLPCSFKNIMNFAGEKITQIQDNLTVIHTTAD